MRRRTELLIRLLKKSIGATLRIPKDFIDAETVDYSFSDDLNDALEELHHDADLTIDTETIDENYHITILINQPVDEETNEEE